jgi:GLPGLI family protein
MSYYFRLLFRLHQLKKTALLILLALTGFGISGFIPPKASSVNDFEGVITYSVTRENPSAAQKIRNEGNTVFYIKGNKIKSVVGGGGSFESSTIFDCNNPDNPVILMNVDGSKYNVKNDPADKMPDPLIKYEDGTKTVAGYTCHKAEITIYYSKDKTNSRNEEVYYSADITGSSCGLLFKGLKGIPLEWVTLKSANNPNEIRTTTLAISVDKKTVSDDEFKIPAEYKVVTKEEMTQDIMNKGSKK